MRVIVTGGTGLVGGEALRAALAHPEVTRVLAIGRRPTGLAHPKLEELVFEDFVDVGRHAGRLAGTGLCLHCLAAYAFRTGRVAYARITVGYLDALLVALEAASPEAAFCMFTSEGTGTLKSRLAFSLATKGRAERRLMRSALPRKYIFRPGYIHPTRPRTRKLFYDPISAPVFRMFPSIGIEAEDLARVMLETGLHDPRPEAVLENREIRALAG
jgi:uncharacterized protein YbjT (DUF2867 family)